MRGEILVVEDNVELRESLALILETEGYQVVTSENGAAALEQLKGAKQPDLILLDLMMPVMDGCEFRRRQLNSPQLSEIPVVLMSAGGRLSSLAVEMKVKNYLEKPMTIEALLEKIESCLHAH